MGALVQLMTAGPLAIFGRVDGEHVSLSCSLSGSCPPMFVGLPPMTLADDAALGEKLADPARATGSDDAERG